MTRTTPITFISNYATDQIKNENIAGFEKEATEVITIIGKVTKCVNGYSSQHTLGSKISELVYRIWNAVKAIFGMSDWQRARRALAKDLPNVIIKLMTNNHMENKETKALVSILERQLLSKSSFASFKNNAADAILHLLISVNENKLLQNGVNVFLNEKLSDKERMNLLTNILKDRDVKEVMNTIGMNPQQINGLLEQLKDMDPKQLFEMGKAFINKGTSSERGEFNLDTEEEGDADYETDGVTVLPNTDYPVGSEARYSIFEE